MLRWDVQAPGSSLASIALAHTTKRLARYMPSTETRATLREVSLLACDLAPVLPEHGEGDDVVVLVHGFFASAGVWRPMKKRLEAELGAKVATFTHAPGATVRIIAQQLHKLVSRIHAGARVHLVGHSLGGVVARWYVQEHGGHTRAAQTIALASPFGGTPAAERFPILVGNDLVTHSHVLTRLRARARVHGVPHLSIVGTEDKLVPHAKIAALPDGDLVELHGRGHNTLLYDDEVIRLVIDRIRSARPAQ